MNKIIGIAFDIALVIFFGTVLFAFVWTVLQELGIVAQ